MDAVDAGRGWGGAGLERFKARHHPSLSLEGDGEGKRKESFSRPGVDAGRGAGRDRSGEVPSLTRPRRGWSGGPPGAGCLATANRKPRGRRD